MTYKGYTNYATYRVMQDVFDGLDITNVNVTTLWCRQKVEETIFSHDNFFLAENYARAFLDEVNYELIVELLKGQDL